MISAGDVLRQHFDRLDVDRAAEPGDQPARAARVIDARARRRRDRRDPAGGSLDRVVGIARQLFGVDFASGQLAELAVGLGDRIETAIEQRIRNTGLLLHPFGERDERGCWSSRRRG